MNDLFKLSFFLLVIILPSCKKTYSCKAKFGAEEFVFKCGNCKKDEVAAYKKEIEKKGYTDVTCEK